MVLIFDLDDTLYDEMSFVDSGLRAVSNYGKISFGWDAAQSFRFMKSHLMCHGRGKIFDEWLSAHGHHSLRGVTDCVKVYRHHKPKISLFPLALQMLEKIHERWPLYLVTDGHKVVQKNKIEALNLEQFFKRTLITHRFGVRNAKPSLHCFEVIRSAERCQWSDMVYVGDNPAKDFVNLNLMGAMTVRVCTGSHASIDALPGHDARVKIPNLATLVEVIEQWHPPN